MLRATDRGLNHWQRRVFGILPVTLRLLAVVRCPLNHRGAHFPRGQQRLLHDLRSSADVTQPNCGDDLIHQPAGVATLRASHAPNKQGPRRPSQLLVMAANRHAANRLESSLETDSPGPRHVAGRGTASLRPRATSPVPNSSHSPLIGEVRAFTSVRNARYNGLTSASGCRATASSYRSGVPAARRIGNTRTTPRGARSQSSFLKTRRRDGGEVKVHRAVGVLDKVLSRGADGDLLLVQHD